MKSFAEAVIELVQGGDYTTMPQMAVAILCHERADEPESRQIKTLAADLGLTKPTVTRSVDALAERGWVSRTQLPGDHRSCVVTLTAVGRKVVKGLV